MVKLAKYYAHLNGELENPFKKTLLLWGDYFDGIHMLSGPLTQKRIAISIGANGRIRGEWERFALNDTRSFVIPGGIIDVVIVSSTQVRVSGTTSEWRVREILSM